MKLSEASEFTYAYTTQSNPAVSVYKRPNLSTEWAIGSVPQGGYSLASIVEACVVHQLTTKHPHPAAVTAQYLTANTCQPETRINIRVIKSGRQFTNLLAEMMQLGKVTISTQLIFSSIPYASPSPSNLLPPGHQSRLLPTTAKPSSLKPTELGSKLSPFAGNMSWSEDPSFISANHHTTDKGGLEWGAYLTLKKEGEWKSSFSAFAGDLFKNAPELREGKEGEWWYPTMTVHLQYLSRVDPADPRYANDKVFIYAVGTFLEEGRHDCSVEVWTCPSSASEKKDGWREEQVCLAKMTQFAWACSCFLLFTLLEVAESRYSTCGYSLLDDGDTNRFQAKLSVNKARGKAKL